MAREEKRTKGNWNEEAERNRKMPNLISRLVKNWVQNVNDFEWGTKLSWRYFNILYHLSRIYVTRHILKGAMKFMDLPAFFCLHWGRETAARRSVAFFVLVYFMGYEPEIECRLAIQRVRYNILRYKFSTIVPKCALCACVCTSTSTSNTYFYSPIFCDDDDDKCVIRFGLRRSAYFAIVIGIRILSMIYTNTCRTRGFFHQFSSMSHVNKNWEQKKFGSFFDQIRLENTNK